MKRRTRESFMPDITPLIDVVFLLLIFFMVSSVFKKNELALLMTLPEATSKTQTSSVSNEYYIEVNQEKMAFNGKPTDLDGLGTLLTSIENKSAYIELRIDKEVKYDRVIRILDLIKNNQLHNLALITDLK